MIYLCYPNNPTGTVATKETLKQWVDYAKANDAIILFDAAYEAFITDPEIPHSIYEVEGARDVAIEFRSFSKNAGFTGTRCAFTVVPKSLRGKTPSGDSVEIHPLWNRRHCTKFNGVSYPIQRGAAAAYSEAGKQQIGELVSFYLENARLLREGLTKVGIDVYGGVNAPCVWLKTPNDLSSWDFRPVAAKGPSGRYAGQRVWRGWRGLLPIECLQQPGECRRSRRTVYQVAGLIGFCPTRSLKIV